MKINLLLLLLIVPMLVQAETIDEYVKNAQNNSMWANSTCGFVEPVLSYDADKLLDRMKWHFEEDKWDHPMEYYTNDGVIILDLNEE